MRDLTSLKTESVKELNIMIYYIFNMTWKLNGDTQKNYNFNIIFQAVSGNTFIFLSCSDLTIP